MSESGLVPNGLFGLFTSFELVLILSLPPSGSPGGRLPVYPVVRIDWARSARVWRVLLVVATLLVLAAPINAEAGDPVCETSNPGPSTGYTTTVCITVPGSGDVLTGEQTVTATASTTHATRTVTEVVFRLDNEYLLTDFVAPYSFVLPTDRWADGDKNIKARAVMSDGGQESADVVLPVTFTNGNDAPPTNSAEFTPRGEDPTEGDPTVIGVVGDGASGKERGEDVVDLIASWDPHMFLQLGDVYERGSIAEMHNWYGATDLWGEFRSITNPTPGNHEYETAGAAPYFYYWDNVPHYYSFEEQGWQFISLDSNSEYEDDQQSPGSDQYVWLEQQLAVPNPCKIVFMHHPRFRPRPAEGTHVASIWNLLAINGVDVVLVGHDHNYQRWVPLDGVGNKTDVGPVQMVVGTGGQRGRRVSPTGRASGIRSRPGPGRIRRSSSRTKRRVVRLRIHQYASRDVRCGNYHLQRARHRAPVGAVVDRSSG